MDIFLSAPSVTSLFLVLGSPTNGRALRSHITRCGIFNFGLQLGNNYCLRHDKQNGLRRMVGCHSHRAVSVSDWPVQCILYESRVAAERQSLRMAYCWMDGLSRTLGLFRSSGYDPTGCRTPMRRCRRGKISASHRPRRWILV
ncbi:hypothetical protein EDB83DRAFT_2346955 [Lactarius deliciosus]|nr:hypothetical protein EDB83DRAFT_2346955 [Lactarius deliciosus]